MTLSHFEGCSVRKIILCLWKLQYTYLMLVSMYVLISDLYVLYKQSLSVSPPPPTPPPHTHFPCLRSLFKYCLSLLTMHCFAPPQAHIPYCSHNPPLPPPPPFSLSLSWLSPETILISLIAPPSLPSFYPIHTKLILFSSPPPLSLPLSLGSHQRRYLFHWLHLLPSPLHTRLILFSSLSNSLCLPVLSKRK